MYKLIDNMIRRYLGASAVDFYTDFNVVIVMTLFDCSTRSLTARYSLGNCHCSPQRGSATLFTNVNLFNDPRPYVSPKITAITHNLIQLNSTVVSHQLKKDWTVACIAIELHSHRIEMTTLSQRTTPGGQSRRVPL